MKFHGETLEGPTIKECTIIYNKKAMKFCFKAVLNFDEMDAICPEPKALYMSGREDGKTRDTDDPDYIKKREAWARWRMEWMFLESISVTEGLEWETVDRNNPETWGNYTIELGHFLTDIQIGALLNTMLAVNTLTQATMDEAEEHFLAERVGRLEDVSCHLVEKFFTLNGEPVSDLDLFLEEFENNGMTICLGNEP